MKKKSGNAQARSSTMAPLSVVFRMLLPFLDILSPDSSSSSFSLPAPSGALVIYTLDIFTMPLRFQTLFSLLSTLFSLGASVWIFPLDQHSGSQFHLRLQRLLPSSEFRLLYCWPPEFPFKTSLCCPVPLLKFPILLSHFLNILITFILEF